MAVPLDYDSSTGLVQDEAPILEYMLLPTPLLTEIGQEADVSYGWDAHAAAWGDYDADGDLDLHVSVINGANLLYRNDSDGTFTEVGATAGVNHSASARGAVFGDVDNDGDLDLYVANEGGVPAVFYQNNGDGTFSDATYSVGLEGAQGGMAPLLADYDKDGHLDLYLTVWGCDTLYHNDGDGTFSNVTTASGINNCYASIGGAWADYDGDGDQDIYIANAGSGPNVLYRNEGNGTFTDVATAAGVDNAHYGEGVAWGDYDNDGDLDLYLTNDWDQANVLYRNNGDATFTDATSQAGVGDTGAGRNPLFADVDNDGDLDLYLVNAGQANVLYRNEGDGTFADVAWMWGGDDTGSGQGAAAGDYNDDGYLDLYVANLGAPNLLYRNDSQDNRWLAVRTVGTVSNRDGIGARVTVACDGQTQMREVRAGTGWLSQDSLPVEFGLGTCTGAVTTTVDWPSGEVQTLTQVATNRTVTVTEEISLPTQADFVASPTSGAAPLTVVFTNTSTGGYTTSLWDFGDGITSTLDSPMHVYTAAGAYTVTLTVSGPGGTDTLSRTNYVTVDPIPVKADFTASPTCGIAPLMVVFTNTSTGDFHTSLWSFGDRTTSTHTSPTHTYGLAGVYSVTLTISGSGGTSTLTHTNYITVTSENDSHFVYLPLAARSWEAPVPPIVTTARVSIDSSGEQGDDSSHSPSISADGRYVAFSSTATNLVDVDTNGCGDVFVHDRQTGQTTLVSVASDGSQGNDGSGQASISADGRFVAFRSYASNLVDNDANGYPDIFVHDRQTGQTTRISVASGGIQGNNDSGYPSISADGRFVAFRSYASNLVSGDANGTWDVFVHDRQTGQIACISVASDGNQGNGYSGSPYAPAISADGRYVAFDSDASNLVSEDTNGTWDIFVRDRQIGQTTRVSIAFDGAQSNGGSLYASISADGRYIAYNSEASNLVANDTNGYWDLFVHDRQTGQTARVSVTSAGSQGDGDSFFPSISADGQRVAFDSYASDLVGDDTNGMRDVFLHNRQTGQTVRISVASNGSQGNGHSWLPSVSGDGRYVAFESEASELVGSDTNGHWDIFVRDRGANNEGRYYRNTSLLTDIRLSPISLYFYRTRDSDTVEK
jgi:PKD repeat protein